VTYKTCNKCHKELPIDNFPPHACKKDGRYGFCRPCRRLADKESRAKRAKTKPPKPKSCRSCENVKPVEDFPKNRSKPDGLHDECKACKKASAKKYYKSNKEFVLSRNKAWRDNNPDKTLERSQLYYQKNKVDFFVRAAKRRSTKLNATLDLTSEQEQEIKDFYWLAKDLTAVSGEKYHVDHIVPLQGDNVCGLHVPWNLQILPADINLSKGNRYADNA